MLCRRIRYDKRGRGTNDWRDVVPTARGTKNSLTLFKRLSRYHNQFLASFNLCANREVQKQSHKRNSPAKLWPRMIGVVKLRRINMLSVARRFGDTQQPPTHDVDVSETRGKKSIHVWRWSLVIADSPFILLFVLSANASWKDEEKGRFPSSTHGRMSCERACLDQWSAWEENVDWPLTASLLCHAVPCVPRG